MTVITIINAIILTITTTILIITFPIDIAIITVLTSSPGPRDTLTVSLTSHGPSSPPSPPAR